MTNNRLWKIVDKYEQLTISDTCTEYAELGMKEFKKKYKNLFTNK